MATLTIRNLDDDVVLKLKARAESNNRIRPKARARLAGLGNDPQDVAVLGLEAPKLEVHDGSVVEP